MTVSTFFYKVFRSHIGLWLPDRLGSNTRSACFLWQFSVVTAANSVGNSFLRIFSACAGNSVWPWGLTSFDSRCNIKYPFDCVFWIFFHSQHVTAPLCEYLVLKIYTLKPRFICLPHNFLRISIYSETPCFRLFLRIMLSNCLSHSSQFILQEFCVPHCVTFHSAQWWRFGFRLCRPSTMC